MRINVVLRLALAAGLLGQAFGQPRPKPFIVRTSEGQSSAQPTAGPMNLSNCLIVMPDGRLHLELHRQEFFGSAVVTAYESALDGKELGILQRILDDAGVSTLHPFSPPVTPMDVDDWQMFTAEIVRGSQIQQVGYLAWHGNGPTNPEADKAAWREARDKLERLVAWSHMVKSRPNWRRVRSPKTWCGQ